LASWTEKLPLGIAASDSGYPSENRPAGWSVPGVTAAISGSAVLQPELSGSVVFPSGINELWYIFYTIYEI